MSEILLNTCHGKCIGGGAEARRQERERESEREREREREVEEGIGERRECSKLRQGKRCLEEG